MIHEPVAPRIGSFRDSTCALIVFAVVSESLDDEVSELFTNYEQAASVVRAWDTDEPDEAGDLHVELIELAAGGLN